MSAPSTLEARTLSVPAGGPDWLSGLRREAAAHFAELGLPTKRLEDWKYTDLSALAALPFAAPAEAPASPSAETVLAQSFEGQGALVVFADGIFVPSLSRLESAPGLSLRPLAQASTAPATDSTTPAARGAAPSLAASFLRLADFQDHAFHALSASQFQDGACIELEAGASVATPIHILHISTGRPLPSYPRNLVLAGRGARAIVVETYAGEAALVCAATEVELADDASIEHVLVQRLGASSTGFVSIAARAARGARFASHVFSFGARTARIEVRLELAGEGASGYLGGLYPLAGERHSAHYTWIDHAAAHCSTEELYKGIVDERATGVFQGRVLVRPGAQKTDARQANRNLVLAETATVESLPQLEIYADDVKCSHGSSTGALDADALFFLRARGLSETQARALLIQAFADEVVDRVPAEGLRSRLLHDLRRTR